MKTYRVTLRFQDDQSDWYVPDTYLESALRGWLNAGCRLIQVTAL